MCKWSKIARLRPVFQKVNGKRIQTSKSVGVNIRTTNKSGSKKNPRGAPNNKVTCVKAGDKKKLNA